MTDLKQYFLALLAKYSIHVESHHEHLIDSFLGDDSINNMFELINNTQKSMIDKFNEKIIIEEIKVCHFALANATVGKHYVHNLDLNQLKINYIKDFNIEIDEKLGLCFDKEKNLISGIPLLAGDYILNFRFSLKPPYDSNISHIKPINLIINPDPKSLWKDEPTPDTIEYYKKDNHSASFGDFVNKKLVIGSKRGRSHAHEAKPRDDAFDYIYNDDRDWGIVAVADGAGSAKFSRQGSELACDAVTKYFFNFDETKFLEIKKAATAVIDDGSEENQKKLSGYFVEELGKAAFSAQKKIREEANSKGLDIREFATTLIFALVWKVQNKFIIASFWVGDGGIGVYSKEKNEVTILGVPDSGEYAGQTRFLTMNDIFINDSYINRIRFKIMDEFTALILMTDGITDPKFQTDANLNNVNQWNELWEDLNGSNDNGCKVDFSAAIEETESHLMNWLDFWSPGNHDDRTIAILY